MPPERPSIFKKLRPLSNAAASVIVSASTTTAMRSRSCPMSKRSVLSIGPFRVVQSTIATPGLSRT